MSIENKEEIHEKQMTIFSGRLVKKNHYHYMTLDQLIWSKSFHQKIKNYEKEKQKFKEEKLQKS